MTLQTDMEMEIKSKKVNSWSVFEINGNIKKNDAKKLKDLCMSAMENHENDIAVNFRKVDFIDSTGLGVLIHCNQTMKKAGGNFVLVNLNEEIYSLLEMTSVDKLFTILDNEKDLRSPN